MGVYMLKFDGWILKVQHGDDDLICLGALTSFFSYGQFY